MKYENYNHSGIKWLGDIPSGWVTRRLKDMGKGIIGLTYSPADIVDEKDGGILVLRSSNIQNDKIDFANNVFVKVKPNKNLIVRKGDILICSRNGSRALIGKNICIDENSAGHTFGAFMTIFRTKYFGYVSYYFKSQLFDYQSGAFMTSTINQLTINTLNNLIIPVPSNYEQTEIATYLNTKIQAIDTKINLLTKKTDHYKDLRKSIINDAVCKGLEKNVKLKESEFIFSVNANWKRYRLKDLGFLYSGLSGKAGDDFNQDDNPYNKGFIPFTNIANNTYLKSNHLGTVVVYENEKQNKVRKGDLFFLMSSEGYDDVGKTAALAEDIPDTYLNSFCKGYRITKKNCEPYFLNYLLLSDNYRKSLITEGKGFTRINLKMEKVTDFFVYLPPSKEEQIAIAAYLDEKTQKIDAIVTNIGKQIETLKELRKTLINDVITGKIKVTL